MIPLTSRSMLSAICRAVRALPVTLMTGAIGIARRRAEAGREHDDLRAAADHAGHRFDVEARRVHHRQALLRDRRRVGDDVLERRDFAALVRGAERLLFDGGQPAADVAGRRLRAADVEAERPRFGLDAGDDLNQLGGRRGPGRARRQQVLGAHDLGDLAEHGRPAEGDEAIGDAPERRIRRQPRGVVRAAALEREHELGGVAPLARLRRRARRRTARAIAVALRRRAHRAALGLNRDDLDRLAVPSRRLGEASARRPARSRAR